MKVNGKTPNGFIGYQIRPIVLYVAKVTSGDYQIYPHKIPVR